MLATRNPDKLAELRRILDAAGASSVDWPASRTSPALPDVAETGRTFAENALLKARAVAAFTGLPAVADDSGLCVRRAERDARRAVGPLVRVARR